MLRIVGLQLPLPQLTSRVEIPCWKRKAGKARGYFPTQSRYVPLEKQDSDLPPALKQNMRISKVSSLSASWIRLKTKVENGS